MKMFRTHNQPQQGSLRRELRMYGTSAEAAMWLLVKGRQLDGFKFRRQFSVGPYVLDFYCPDARLCLELDGQPHFTLSGDTHDTDRDAYLLREHGIRTLRFENRDVFQNTEGVLEVIRAALRETAGSAGDRQRNR